MTARWRLLCGKVAPLALIVALVALAPPAAAGAVRAGALDPGFGMNGRVVTQTELGGGSWPGTGVHVAEGPSGTIVAAVANNVFRYLPDGELDSSFGEGGRLTVADPGDLPFSLHDIAVDDEGRVYAIGDVEIPDVDVPINYMWALRHPTLAAVIRYGKGGRLDSSFGDGKGYLLTDLGQPSPYGTSAPYKQALTSLASGVLDGSGRLVAVGSVAGFPCSKGHSELTFRRKLIARLTPAGTLDPSFGDGAGSQAFAAIDEIDALAVGIHGEIAVAGSQVDECTETSTIGVGRLRPDGSPDTGFRRGGFRTLPESPRGIALDRYGRIDLLLAGWRVLRLTPSGKPDRRFAHRGQAFLRLPTGTDPSSILVEPSGRILLTGTKLGRVRRDLPGRPRYGRSFVIVRLDAQGHLDRRFGRRGLVVTGFGRRSHVRGEDAIATTDKRLVVGGPISRPDLAPTGGIALARYRLGR